MRRLFKKYGANDDGSSTIESILWLPFMLSIFIFAGEVSNIFFAQNRMQQVLQEGNRLFSVGFIQEKTELESYILNRLEGMAPNATLTASVSGGTVTTVASVPVSDMLLTSMFASFLDFSVSMKSSQYVEY